MQGTVEIRRNDHVDLYQLYTYRCVTSVLLEATQMYRRICMLCAVFSYAIMQILLKSHI